ncbi:integrase [Bacillus cereus group sp. BY9-3LC]|uniref:integrase n=1 Tax=Bacillus cereus group sp. BY9-3LC TaxID=3018075 RepID=UPI0022DEC67B|nr:integrase [Bacillus cereus group sp. BY9-3LC]MDA1777167.1 integrase [Bacillus cereus group sp. BY9-3LC]
MRETASVKKSIEIAELSDEAFELEYSIELAIENLKSMEINRLSEVDFHKNLWKLYDEEKDIIFYFRFNRLEEELQGKQLNQLETLTLVMKCWVASLLVQYHFKTVQTSFRYVLDELITTECFRLRLLEDFIEKIMLKGDRTKSSIASALLNFFNYYDNFEGAKEYLNFLSTIPSSKPKTRTIPTVKDCLKFAWVLNDFYTQSNNTDWKYTYFYPVRIWWHLTTVIPIRIGEFLLLRRDCVDNEGNRYYLYLSRIKNKKSRAKKTEVERIEISCKLYNMVKEYIELTEEYGYSKTLLSYRAYKGISLANKLNSSKIKRNPNVLTRWIFHTILNDFYDDVIATSPYNFTVRSVGEDSEQEIRQSRNNSIVFDFERRLRPNDTRHIAFLSLMIQGFHPVEIARLGGHDTVYGQRHYQQHEFFLTDSGISKLIKMFSFTGQFLKGHNSNVTPSNNISNIGKMFREKFIFSPAKTSKNEWDKLEIGNCTAIIKDCQTQCFRCGYWRIEYDEFIEKRETIEQWMLESREEALALYKTVFNLHLKLVSKVYSKVNLKLTNDLAIHSKRLKGLLENIDGFTEKYGSWLEDE